MFLHPYNLPFDKWSRIEFYQSDLHLCSIYMKPTLIAPDAHPTWSSIDTGSPPEMVWKNDLSPILVIPAKH